MALCFPIKKTWKKICRPENVTRLKQVWTKNNRDELSHFAPLENFKSSDAPTHEPMCHDMTTGNKRPTAWQWFVDFVMVYWRVHEGIRLPGNDVAVEKAKWKHVALSKVKMDCRCRQLSPFFCQFLSAVGESGKHCRHIFYQCRLSPGLRYELNGFSFVAFKLFSNEPVFEKEQTAQLVLRKQWSGGFTSNKTCYRYLSRNLLSCRKGS